jgi:hypothetical protein
MSEAAKEEWVEPDLQPLPQKNGQIECEWRL